METFNVQFLGSVEVPYHQGNGILCAAMQKVSEWETLWFPVGGAIRASVVFTKQSYTNTYSCKYYHEVIILSLLFCVIQWPFGGAASIDEYYDRVSNQSYFSELGLSVSTKCALGLQNGHYRLVSLMEAPHLVATANQSWSLRCEDQQVALHSTSHVGVLRLDKSLRVNSTWRSSWEHDEATTAEGEDEDSVAESSEIHHVNNVMQWSSNGINMYNCKLHYNNNKLNKYNSLFFCRLFGLLLDLGKCSVCWTVNYCWWLHCEVTNIHLK